MFKNYRYFLSPQKIQLVYRQRKTRTVLIYVQTRGVLVNMVAPAKGSVNIITVTRIMKYVKTQVNRHITVNGILDKFLYWLPLIINCTVLNKVCVHLSL